MRANVDRDSSRAAREEDLSTLRRRQAISLIRCWLGNPPVEIVVSLVTVAGPDHSAWRSLLAGMHVGCLR